MLKILHDNMERKIKKVFNILISFFYNFFNTAIHLSRNCTLFYVELINSIPSSHYARRVPFSLELSSSRAR